MRVSLTARPLRPHACRARAWISGGGGARVRALVGAALLGAAGAGCADAPALTAPGVAEGPGDAELRPSAGPSFGVVGTDGRYWEGFDFLSSGGAPFGTPGGPPWPDHPPTPWKPADFDVAIHSRDPDTWYAPERFRAMHGPNCAPHQDATPFTDAGSHEVTTYDDLNFRCRNHMMTAIGASGYGVVYVTPDAMVDWSTGEAVVKFALSTLRTSGRDWVDLWITPWEDNLKLPLDASLAGTDLQGPPRAMLHVRMVAEAARSRFEAYYANDFAEGKLPVVSTDGYEKILVPVSTRRDTFELRVSRYRVRFGMRTTAPRPGQPSTITWIDASVRLPFSRGVVQLGHHSHAPTTGGGRPGTWHWDDVTIAPAVPFGIVLPQLVDGTRRRHVDAASAATPIVFERPAPADAFVRFAAIGAGIQLSVDGGATWTAARVQRAALDRADRFRSYWTPIPAGTQQLHVRRDPASAGTWFARDFAIWSRNR